MSYPRFFQVNEYGYLHITSAAGTPTATPLATAHQAIGAVIVGTLGTGLTITVYDGSSIVSVITPTAPGAIPLGILCRSGLKYTVAGSGFDVTLAYADLSNV